MHQYFIHHKQLTINGRQTKATLYSRMKRQNYRQRSNGTSLLFTDNRPIPFVPHA